MIKPEDITHDLIIDWIKDGVSHSWPDFIARRLNAAIEAGIVSPPCRILRSQWGSLQTDAIYIDDNAAQAAASPGDSSEHWKGQTE